jgi:hypothetical protein
MSELGTASSGTWSDEDRFKIVQSAWYILLKRDAPLMRRVLSVLRRWYDEDDLRADLFLRGWLVVDYARGNHRECANYVYSVMANRLREIARKVRRRSDAGFSEADSLQDDTLQLRYAVDGSYVDWLQSRELEVLRLRVSCLEDLLRKHAGSAYQDYRKYVDEIVNMVLAEQLENAKNFETKMQLHSDCEADDGNSVSELVCSELEDGIGDEDWGDGDAELSGKSAWRDQAVRS